LSVAGKIIRKITKHKGLSFGIVYILLTTILALFAYYIAPDKSPYANRMVVEIGGKKPGYRQLFFKEKKQHPVSQSFWDKFLNGTKDSHEWIPIVSYTIQGDYLMAEKYVDEGITEPMKFYIKGLLQKQYLEEKTFRLGTDKFGRDILSRLLAGARISLSVGAIAVLLSLTIGIMLGAIAGYRGGRIDRLIMWFVQVVWSLPTLLFVLGVMLLLGKGYIQVFLAIGLSLWVNVARMVRGEVMAAKELAYVEAARTLGLSDSRILFRHILPNIMGSVWVMAAANFATAIMLEAGLSFLGLGIPPPQPSWGLMLKEHYNFIITQNPALALAPGIAIALTVFAFQMMANGLRDLLDVRSV
jgi:peptide/nickel transport system permease protein